MKADLGREIRLTRGGAAMTSWLRSSAFIHSWVSPPAGGCFRMLKAERGAEKLRPC